MKAVESVFRLIGGWPTLVVASGLVVLIYAPRFFQTNREKIDSAYRDCDWAITSNIGIQERCELFARLAEAKRGDGTTIEKGSTFLLAKYRYLSGNVVAAKSYCTESIAFWKAWRDSMDGTTAWSVAQIRNANAHIDQCEMMLRKHP